MAQPVPNAPQYFLGISGEQSGPHSENDIVQKIKAGEVPPDALFWFEGMSEWQSVQSSAAFKDAFVNPDVVDPQSEAHQTGRLAPSNFKPLEGTQAFPTFSTAGAASDPGPTKSDAQTDFSYSQGDLHPVFTKDEGAFSRADIPPSQKLALLALGLIIFLGAVYYGLNHLTSSSKVVIPTGEISAADRAKTRDADFLKAQNELLLSPNESIATLRRLATENVNDKVGKQALDSLLQYYRLHSPLEAAKLLMSVKQPEQALPFFLNDPADLEGAETALKQILENEKDPLKRKKYLSQSVETLLSLKKEKEAAELVRQMVREFPNEPTPYSYYLKTNGEKVQDLFERLAFLYTKSLGMYLEAEFPQLNFPKKPIVELRKEKNDQYRITAHYEGEVLLNHDQLPAIHFEFWQVNSRWELIDTNITAERSKSAKVKRQQLAGQLISEEDMLKQLEHEFHTQFPKNALHQVPSRTDSPTNP